MSASEKNHMDETSAKNASNNIAGRIAAALGYAALLIVIGVLLPPRLKLFGIYPLLLGGLLGWGIGKLFAGSKVLVCVAIPLLVLLSIVVWNGQHLWLHEQYAAVLRKSFEADPTRGWKLEENAAPAPNESDSERRQREDFQKELTRIDRIRSEKTSFQGYLIARSGPLGVRTTTGAWAIYLGEMCFMIIGSLFSLFRSTPFRSSLFRSTRKLDSNQAGT